MYSCTRIRNNNFKIFAMKRIIYFVLLTSYVGFSQQTGLIIENSGNVYRPGKTEFPFESDKEYKVIFDVFTDDIDKNKVNPKLATVVNYLSAYTQEELPKENLKITVILHGLATKNALNDAAYKKLFDVENPNSTLIKELKDANVEFYVSGKSYYGKVYEFKDKLPSIKLAYSAIATLKWYQADGYEVINFN